jgi:hypothetical protein
MIYIVRQLVVTKLHQKNDRDGIGKSARNRSKRVCTKKDYSERQSGTLR